ncbi:MAG: hypothetical protein KBT21_03920 [Treponema sp.]|nr:hypothetical protein [Candidatus Treponema merdequi]
MKKSNFILSAIKILSFTFLVLFSSCVSTPKTDPVAEEWMQKYPLNDFSETFVTKRNSDVIISEIKNWISRNYKKSAEYDEDQVSVLSFKVIDKDKVLCTIAGKTKYNGDLSYNVLIEAVDQKINFSVKDALLYAKCATAYDVPMTFDISMKHSEGFTKPEWELFRKNGSELYQKEINLLKDAVKQIAEKE